VQLFLLVLIIAADHRLYPSCGDIDSCLNNSGAGLDCRGNHSDRRIGHGNDRTA